MTGDGSHTEDSLFDGSLTCCQHRHGYRFSVDSVLLSHFSRPRRRERILDLGAGCGIIALILAYRWPDIMITCLELQPAMVELLQRNINANSFQERITVVHGNLCQVEALLPAEGFAMVFCNPPYRKAASGRLNPVHEQAVARHELEAGLGDAVRAAHYALRNRGRAVFVYPAARGAALLHTLKAGGLEPKRLQAVYSRPGETAKLLLVEAVKNGGEQLQVLPPFYIYQGIGGYSEEMGALYVSGPGVM